MAPSLLLGMPAPVATPLPPLPPGDVFTPDQWRTLLSLMDTFMPSITPARDGKDDLRQLVLSDESYKELEANLAASAPLAKVRSLGNICPEYLSENVSSIPNAREYLQRLFTTTVPGDKLKAISVILSLLNTRAGALLLTGSTTPFHLKTFADRTATVQSWSMSYLPPLRALFRSFSGLAKRTWIANSPTLPRMISFPSFPIHETRNESYPFKFIQFEASPSPAELETEVVIVGSGCGAGVCARNLAEAGYRVLVVEKSYHFPSTHFPMSQQEADAHLFEGGGVMVSDDTSTSIVAGSTWGGGGTVNWSASLQPQHFVRQEWAGEGLPLFTSAEFQECLDRVCGVMGVGTKHIEHNFANKTLLEGARRLGYAGKDVPQNTGNKEHYCGYCHTGCVSGTKQGPANRWLPDAADRGAQFIEGLEVREVLFEDTLRGGKKRAVGVKGNWMSRDRNIRREVVVNAERVIVACGTLQSPLLLMRSGIDNAHLGKNLHLHPASGVGALFDEEVRPWEGGIITSVITSFENLDGRGHGPKLEIVSSIPTIFLNLTPWKDALDYRVQCTKLHRAVGVLSLERDRDTGRVYPDPNDGRCRIAYTPSTFDLNNCMQGVLAAAKIMYFMGAREIFTFGTSAPRFVRADTSTAEDPEKWGLKDDSAFEQWLSDINYRGLTSPDPCMLASAHQMGTCRMSSDEKKGVVDPSGLVWGTERLFVADASVFPSASGVNPMVTNMGIADWISRGISVGLKAGSRSEVLG